ncbi:hypothetical protein [Clostridium thermobutyricum]|uniref:hypothetical protein n=1 Tax=Clostridium thermobutyricum TaxID=29372 RepID=UPI003F524C01
MNKKISKYLKKIVSNTNLNAKERKCLYESLSSNFNERYSDYIETGMNKELAFENAKNEIGDIKEFEIELNKNINCINPKLQYIAIFFSAIFIMLCLITSFTNGDVFEYHIFQFRYLLNLKYILLGLVPFAYLPFMLNYLNSSLISNYFIVFIFYIPVGIFVPIALNRINNFRYNLKIFFFFALIIEISKFFGTARATTTLLLINVFLCIIGYMLTKLIFSLLNRS